MNRTTSAALALGLLACGLAAGCGQERTLTVDREDPQERAAVSVFATERANYHYRLTVLQAYYKQVGNHDKLTWATRELENLEQSQVVQWKGLPEVVPPEGEAVRPDEERSLVELVVAARRRYLDAVQRLYDLYQDGGEAYKAMLVQRIIEAYSPVRTYMYFLDAEIPGPDLQPTNVIPEADRTYERAMQLYEEGKLVPGFPDVEKEEKALTLLLKLVRKHPRSTKIALAAYHIAEIYKEFVQPPENVRAVHWYRRAWQWDPEIDKPARFQAALIYDIRLHDLPKAVELYREAIEHDPYRLGNEETARNRIEELTGSRP